MESNVFLKLSGVFLVGLLAACGGSGSSGSSEVSATETSGSSNATGSLSSPHASVAVSTKQLTFEWSAVEGASHYRLLMNVEGVSGFTQVGGDISSSLLSAAYDIPVHLLNWDDVAFVIEACDSVTCTASGSLSVSGMMMQAVGAISDPLSSNKGFGFEVALSSDGLTLAVADPDADVGELSVQDEAGLVFIYEKTNSGWVERQTISAPMPDADDHFGYELALNADGSLLVVGVPDEDSSSAVINGDQSDNFRIDAGAVYTYRKVLSGTWSFDSYIKPSVSSSYGDGFGAGLALDDSGNQLAVASNNNGRVFVFARDSGGDWNQEFIIEDEAITFGDRVSVSADGTVLAASAYDEALTDHVVYTYARTPINTWEQQDLIASTSGTHYFGREVKLSGDAQTLFVGDTLNSSGFPGINVNEADTSVTNSGAAYIYVNDGSGNWTQQAFFKASDPTEFRYFGVRGGLSDNGDIVAVSCIGGSRYIFIRDDESTWRQLNKIDPRVGSYFDRNLALSGDGLSLMMSLGDGEGVLFY